MHINVDVDDWLLSSSYACMNSFKINQPKIIIIVRVHNTRYSSRKTDIR
jgi:hypothetical protein